MCLPAGFRSFEKFREKRDFGAKRKKNEEISGKNAFSEPNRQKRGNLRKKRDFGAKRKKPRKFWEKTRFRSQTEKIEEISGNSGAKRKLSSQFRDPELKYLFR